MNNKRLTPMDILLSKVNMRCTKCNVVMNTAVGDCDCWEKCTCGWLFERGVEIGCSNSECNHNRWGKNDK